MASSASYMPISGSFLSRLRPNRPNKWFVQTCVWARAKRKLWQIFGFTPFLGFSFFIWFYHFYHFCQFSFLFCPFLVLLTLQSPLFPLEKLSPERQGKSWSFLMKVSNGMEGHAFLCRFIAVISGLVHLIMFIWKPC